MPFDVLGVADIASNKQSRWEVTDIFRISETVAALAKSIEDSYSNLSPRHRLIIQLFKMMPDYRDCSKLVAWDSAVRSLLEDEKYEFDELIERVWQFGNCNFYGAFDVDCAMSEFQRCSDFLVGRGIAVPDVRKLSKY